MIREIKQLGFTLRDDIFGFIASIIRLKIILPRIELLYAENRMNSALSCREPENLQEHMKPVLHETDTTYPGTQQSYVQ